MRLEMRLELDAQQIIANADAFAHGMPADAIGAELARLLDKLRRQIVDIFVSRETTLRLLLDHAGYCRLDTLRRVSCSTIEQLVDTWV